MTRLERMQDVQTLIRCAAPFTITRIRCKLMFQRRLETLWAWLILFPNRGPLPQTSHTFAIGCLSPFLNAYRSRNQAKNQAGRRSDIFA